MLLFTKGFFTGILVMALIGIICFMLYRQYHSKKTSVEIEATTIINSIESISKLMVMEGQFTETYSYQEKSKVFFDLIPQEKKALIILDAKVLIGYDLKKMEIFVDKKNRKIVIEKIPEEEVNIIPDLKFYDIQSSTFSSFDKNDMNKVQVDAKERIAAQVEKSQLKEQARQRLMENINSLVMMSRAIGWKVEDKTNTLFVGNIKMLDSW